MNKPMYKSRTVLKRENLSVLSSVPTSWVITGYEVGWIVRGLRNIQ
jgi:hypothetical protein